MKTTVAILITIFLITGCSRHTPLTAPTKMQISNANPQGKCHKIGTIIADYEPESESNWLTNQHKCDTMVEDLKAQAKMRGANYLWIQPNRHANRLNGIAYWCPDDC